MRLYSIHPKYLDQKGLCGLWREALLGQRCLLKGEYIECPCCYGSGDELVKLGACYSEDLVRECTKCKGTGKIKTPYWNHPQLIRWKKKPIESLKNYLCFILEEANKRGYNFDKTKIQLDHDDWVVDCPNDEYFIEVTKGQLDYEFKHLCRKVMKRDRDWFIKIRGQEFRDNYVIKANPIFKVVDGNVESWEKIK